MCDIVKKTKIYIAMLIMDVISKAEVGNYAKKKSKGA